MLKHIHPCISPDLLKVLMEMGHGDEIVLADGNFPAASHTKYCIRADGMNIPEMLEGILNLLPLDYYVEHPIVLMMHGPEVARPEIWSTYDQLIRKETGSYNPLFLERHAFYERTKNAYAIVATSEGQLYANIILKKGVIARE